ncbi:MAG: hypothetical protein LCH95_25290 [Proteobacteria bacterium]|nr:hypothetical protein [Pseudomonadota bacterium]
MPNLLHILAALALSACLWILSREARGASRSRSYLMLPAPFAVGAALLMIGLIEPGQRQADLLRLALAIGAALGLLRGWFVAVEVDPLWSTVRLPGGSDGFWTAAAMLALLVLATALPLASATLAAAVPFATAGVLLGAAFLSARAATVYLRTRG